MQTLTDLYLSELSLKEKIKEIQRLEGLLGIHLGHLSKQREILENEESRIRAQLQQYQNQELSLGDELFNIEEAQHEIEAKKTL